MPKFVDDTEMARAMEAERFAKLSPRVRNSLMDVVCEAMDRFSMTSGAVMLIGAEQFYVAAGVGMGTIREGRRSEAFCNETVATNMSMVIDDAKYDSRFRDYGFVSGELGIRFYAGAPLVTAAGLRVGSICVMDREARKFSPRDKFELQVLALRAVVILEGADDQGSGGRAQLPRAPRTAQRNSPTGL